jgi:hypothetical protein
MDVVEIGRIGEEESGGATVPARYSTRAGTVHEREKAARVLGSPSSLREAENYDSLA